MPALRDITARFTAKLLSRILGVLLVAAIAAPYAHAALEITEHEQCGMEVCKRAGHCCCRRSQPGKPHWTSHDICHHCAAQPPAVISPATTPEPLAIGTILRIAATPLPAAFPTPSTVVLLPIQFQKPPPIFS